MEKAAPRRIHPPHAGGKIADAILNVVMILLLCFFLYPLLNMISISLSDEFAVLRADVTFYPIGFNPQAYDLILQSEDLWRSIYNSTFVALVGCVCSLIGLSLRHIPWHLPSSTAKGCITC